MLFSRKKIKKKIITVAQIKQSIVENPCPTCIIEMMCAEMCPRAKPYWMGLKIEDKNFNQKEYDYRVGELYHRIHQLDEARRNS